MKNNKILKYIIGAVSAVALIIATVLISIEITINDNKFYVKEYNKYSVDKDLKMTMDDVLYVSSEMMDYLKGNRDNLVVYTTMNGKKREFFNNREKEHMVDVKNMLQTAIMVRIISLGVFLSGVILLLLLKDKVYVTISKAFIWATGIVTAFIGALSVIISIGNFTVYWEMFHELFFSNDLWLLNPSVDMMILMLPEGFFIDLIIRSVITFVIFVGVLAIIASVLVHRSKRSNKYLQN